MLTWLVGWQDETLSHAQVVLVDLEQMQQNDGYQVINRKVQSISSTDLFPLMGFICLQAWILSTLTFLLGNFSTPVWYFFR